MSTVALLMLFVLQQCFCMLVWEVESGTAHTEWCKIVLSLQVCKPAAMSR